MTSTATASNIRIETIPDTDYVPPDGVEIAPGGYVGVRAVATISVGGTAQEIRSGGLWGIGLAGTAEDEAYLEEVGREQREELQRILAALAPSQEERVNAKLEAAAEAFRGMMRAAPKVGASGEKTRVLLELEGGEGTHAEIAERFVRDCLDWYQLGASGIDVELQAVDPPRPADFLRSIDDCAGTIRFTNGREQRGWVLDVEQDHFRFLCAQSDDGPGDDLNDTGTQRDDRILSVVRLDAVQSFEYAGEDGW